MLGLCRTRNYRVVTWNNGRFYVPELLLKPEVLTPNRNGFMAKTRYWHLKAGSTVAEFNPPMYCKMNLDFMLNL